jgi:V/A-type H+-transporting ATPase subunit I
MRKYTFVVYSNDYAGFLRALQDIGVVHIVEKKSAQDDDGVRQLGANAARISRALQILGRRKTEAGVTPANKDSAEAVLSELDICLQEKEKLDQALVILNKEIGILQPWGDMPVTAIEALAREQVHAKFYVVSNKKFSEQWSAAHAIAVVHNDGTNTYFVRFIQEGGAAEPELLGAEEVRLPQRVLSAALAEREKSVQANAELQTRISALAMGNAPDMLRAELAHILSEADFTRATLSADAGVEDQVRILQGWVPAEREAQVAAAADAKSVVTLAEDPAEEDDVPIQLKNGTFSRLFEPISKMFALPTYMELDLTAFFAPFFTLFFGLCLGDGGYGLVIMVACLAARFKVKKDVKPLCTLGFIFGFATLVVGCVTSNFFGVTLYESFPSLKQYILFTDTKDLFNLALGIGLVQIIFGMCIQVANRWRQSGFLAALPTIGWIIIIFSLLGMAGAELVGEGVANIAQYTALVGVVLILFFNDLRANIFLRIGKGVWELYNITGIFGDLLSYVRLFALGLSGGVLGIVVNQLGGQLLGIPVIGIVLYALFLLVGHTGVLLLSALGAFVHPMRLTFVEFYKNAGFTGGGKAYKPLAAKKIK